MLCRMCGSTQFEEENGLLYCCYCQTQSQGFTQETVEDYVNLTNVREITKKPRIGRQVVKKTGVLWTTTEAFNLILFKQMNLISDIISETIDSKEFIEMTSLIWFTYLHESGLALTDGEKSDTKEVNRRLHPASRFRDIQILSKRVDDFLPTYRNGSTELGFQNLFSLGTDGVIRSLRELEEFKEFESKLTEEQFTYELFDIFFHRYRDPRNYSKIRNKGMKISKESRKQLHDFLDKTPTELLGQQMESFDNLDDSINESPNDEIDSKDSIISSDSFGDDYDKELMKNMTKTTKLFSQYIPFSHLKKSSNVSSNYFIDLMSLPKTLSILNLTFRLLCYDIYCFDLIRWANEGHIPYFNCITCLPEDWTLFGNDFHTFTSKCVPSFKTINILSAKIAHHIGINSFPRPDLEKLLIRFVKDLNLPKDLVNIIQSDYDLFKHFGKKIDKLSDKFKCQSFPYFEVWTLMTIVLILKRIFILNDSSEKHLSYFSESEKQFLFNWNEWENYTRIRVELIRSYFIPNYTGDLEDIRDTDLMVNHFIQKVDSQPIVGINKNNPYKHLEFKSEVQKHFEEFMFDRMDQNSTESTSQLKPSLYPLTNATNFALSRINSQNITEKMSINFEDKLMSPWICSHGKVFHRGYHLLDSDPNKWSDSFQLLIYLSCFILNCRVETLTPILFQMERIYFKNKRD